MTSTSSTSKNDSFAALRRASASPWAAALFVLALVVFSGWIRTRSISSSFWMDEALSVGIASHDLMNIPHVLRQDGSPPGYYMLLSVWMGWFGRTETATHALSVVAALVSIPIGVWAGWTLFSRRAGLILGTLMATAVFITSYAEETRMYAWMATLALAAVTTFCLAFVMRRRGWIIGFGLVLAIMLYTHGWALFFGVACGAAWLLLVWQSADRKGLVRDGILGFAIAAVLFLPWLPTLAFQAAHTGAPWSSSPGLGVVSQVASLLGGWATAGALSIGALAGLIAIWFRQPASAGNAATEATPERQRLSLQSIAIIAFGTVGIAWLSSQFNPAWSTRYMAAVIGPILLILAAGAARAGVVGVFGVVVAVAISLVSPVDNVLRVKSDVRDIAANVRGDLRPGDLVISGQPEQTPLSWYYMPGGLQFADSMGRNRDPRMLNWADVVDRVKAAKPVPTYSRLIGSLPVGARILMIRPLTISSANWVQPWTRLVRLRSAQWSGLLSQDPRLVRLRAVPWFYISPSGVGNSAVLYEKRRAAGQLPVTAK